MLSSRMDGGIHQTNYYFHGQGGKQFFYLAPVVQKRDSATQWINHYPVDNTIGLPTTYQLDSNNIYLVDSAIQLLNNQGQLEFF